MGREPVRAVQSSLDGGTSSQWHFPVSAEEEVVVVVVRVGMRSFHVEACLGAGLELYVVDVPGVVYVRV